MFIKIDIVSKIILRGLVKCRYILLFSTLLLTSCGSMHIDTGNSDLMPKSVAISVFRKHGLGKWVENPVMSSPAFWCNHEEKQIEFNQIDTAHYGKKTNQLMLIDETSTSCSMWFRFNNVTELQALELTNALRSLGATNIEKLQWYY